MRLRVHDLLKLNWKLSWLLPICLKLPVYISCLCAQRFQPRAEMCVRHVLATCIWPPFALQLACAHPCLRMFKSLSADECLFSTRMDKLYRMTHSGQICWLMIQGI